MDMFFYVLMMVYSLYLAYFKPDKPATAWDVWAVGLIIAAVSL